MSEPTRLLPLASAEPLPELTPADADVFVPNFNPRNLPIHHVRGACTMPRTPCSPRFLGVCAACRVELNLCTTSQAEVAEMLAKTWRCDDCGGA